jgi:hypothetical protein
MKDPERKFWGPLLFKYFIDNRDTKTYIYFVEGGNPMATSSFTKNILVTDPEAVARFVELISQPPKPISEEIRKLGEEQDRKAEETLELIKRLSSR